MIICYSVKNGRFIEVVTDLYKETDGVWLFETEREDYPLEITHREQLEEMGGFTYLRTYFPIVTK